MAFVDFNHEQKLFKALDLETTSWFFMRGENCWGVGPLNDLLFFLWNEEVYELVLFCFCLLIFNPFLMITCSVNDWLKLTLQKKSDYWWSKKEMKMHKTIKGASRGPWIKFKFIKEKLIGRRTKNDRRTNEELNYTLRVNCKVFWLIIFHWISYLI